MPINIVITGMRKPVVKKSLKASFFNLKKSTLVAWIIPRDKKGISIKTELLSKLSKPFSSTLMYRGLEYIKRRRKATDFAKKLEKV